MNKKTRFALLGLALFALPYAASAATVTITMSDNQFTPQNVTVNPGDIITWVNHGTASHTATADGGAFDSQTLAPGASYSIAFSGTGTYAYHDKTYGAAGGTGMSGVITVATGAVTTTTTTTTTNTGSNFTVGTSTSAALSVTGVHAPTTLQIQQSGTWTIFALAATSTDPLLYAALWGDSSSTSATASPTFTHTYTQVGTYAPKFTVSDASSSDVINVSTSVVVSDNETPPTNTSSCADITMTLSIGMTDAQTGGQVSDLQQFLTDHFGLDGTLVVGTFGPKTQSYVEQFQTEQGISPVGFVGPQTRAAIAGLCSSMNAPLSATPTSGNAPLTVQMHYTLPSPSGSYSLDFGDGQSQQSIPNACAGGPNCLFVSHTYSSAGTYTAKLQQTTGGGTNTQIGTQTLGTATITVCASSATSCTPSTFSATPSSGAAPLTVTFTGIVTGNNFTLDFGDNSTPQASTCSDGCTTLAVNTTHTYTAGGTFSAKLIHQSSSLATSTVGTATVTVTGAPLGSCAAPTHDLSLGTSDSDVSGDVTVLQQFLVLQGTTIYPQQLVTGFFGNATQAAVMRYQTATNISATGFVGPLTRAAIAAQCAGTTPGTPTPSTTKYSFSVTPTSGEAPLSVTFSAINAETLETGLTYVVDFGDNSRGSMNAGTATNTLAVSHTYQNAGTFNAKLLQERNVCGSFGTGYGCVSDLQVDSATTTVSAPTCPSGQTLTNNQCVSSTPTCTSGQALGSDNVCHPVCLTGQTLGSDNVCHSTTCPTGQTLASNGVCQTVTATQTSCTTAQFNNGSQNLQFMNYPGTDAPMQGVANPMSSTQYLTSSFGNPTTITYPAGTVLRGDPEWWDGLSTTGVPPSVNCAVMTPGDACVTYQCMNGTWVTYSNPAPRGQ